MSRASERRYLLTVGVGADSVRATRKSTSVPLWKRTHTFVKSEHRGVFSVADLLPYPNIGLTVAESVRAGELDHRHPDMRNWHWHGHQCQQGARDPRCSGL